MANYVTQTTGMKLFFRLYLCLGQIVAPVLIEGNSYIQGGGKYDQCFGGNPVIFVFDIAQKVMRNTI